MKRMIIILALLASYASAYGMPGYLLLVGGGTEQNTPNSWNAEAYAWAVEQSDNKKVGIVHYESGSSWLEDYFVNHCGAEEAQSIIISSRSEADQQATYDQLIGYDVLFFRGGDQYEYYQTYKGTKTQDAIAQVFSGGGVLAGTSAGMAMLSGVMFTAKNGTVYPEECIENPQNSYITLADDFLDVFPGWVFDTHVAERGRLPRSLGFMANWYLNHEAHINAVSLDDMTALAIDTGMQATVYGTGAARILLSGENTTYRTNNSRLIAQNVQVHQLLQGWGYHFESGNISTPGAETQTLPDRDEHGAYTILASGTNNRAYNDAMISRFIDGFGDKDDPVLVIHGYNAPDAPEYEAQLNTMGVPFQSLQASVGNMNNPDNLAKVREAEKFLFVNNNAASLLNFLNNSDAGQKLAEKLRHKGRVSAFVGDDSRMAGKTVVENYKTEGASYYHKLTFGNGLGLLDKTVIMPNTFYKDTTELYENTQTAVPYAIARDTLVNGVWLNRRNYMVYNAHGDTSYLKSYGNWPMLVMRRQEGAFGFSEQTSYGYASDDPRMVAGLEHYRLFALDASDSLQIGAGLTSTGLNLRGQQPKEQIHLYPVPTSETLHVRWKQQRFAARVYNMQGQMMLAKTHARNQLQIDTSAFRAGVYFIDFISNPEGLHFRRTFVVE